MIKIFSGLFGGLFLGGKLLADKAEEKAFDQKSATMQQEREMWLSQVYDQGLERELKQSQRSTVEWQSDKAMVLSIVRTFRGMQNADYKIASRGKSGEFVNEMLLVMQGRLPWEYTLPSFYLNDSILEAFTIVPDRYAKIDYVRWIEKTLQENGVPNARLYCRKRPNWWTEFIWEPDVWDRNTVIRVTDKRIEQFPI